MMTVLVLSLFLSPDQNQGRFPWKLEQKTTGTFDGTLNWTVKNPGFENVEWIAISPKPPNLPGQKVLSSMLFPGETEEFADESVLKRPFLRNRILVKKENTETQENSGGKDSILNAKFTTQVTLFSRKLVSLNPREMAGNAPQTQPDALSVTNRKNYLRSSSTIDHETEEFRQWMKKEKLQRQPGEDDFSLAKRFFFLIRSRYSLKADPKISRRASFTATRTEADYGSLNALFVAMCRSQGIPARSLVGRLAKSTQLVTPLGGGAAHQNHQWYIRSEWWQPSLGWVPVDLLAGLGADRSEAGNLKWFGNDPGDLIVFHQDFDVILDPLLFEKKEILATEGIAVWSVGKGKLEGQSISEDWMVKKAPPKKATSPGNPNSKK